MDKVRTIRTVWSPANGNMTVNIMRGQVLTLERAALHTFPNSSLRFLELMAEMRATTNQAFYARARYIFTSSPSRNFTQTFSGQLCILLGFSFYQNIKYIYCPNFWKAFQTNTAFTSFCVSFYMNFANDKFLSMFLFCLGVWGNYFGFWVPVVSISICCASCCALGGSSHQSISASLLWRHSFQPSSTDHVNIATGASSQTQGSCLMRKYLWWKFHIFMMTSQELWNISNSLETAYSSHSRKFSSPSLCQLSGAGTQISPPMTAVSKQRCPDFTEAFFHRPRIFVQFQFPLTAKLTTNRLL